MLFVQQSAGTFEEMSAVTTTYKPTKVNPGRIPYTVHSMIVKCRNEA